MYAGFENVDAPNDLLTLHGLGTGLMTVIGARQLRNMMLVVLISPLIHFLVVLCHVEVGIKFLVGLLVSHELKVYTFIRMSLK